MNTTKIISACLAFAMVSVLIPAVAFGQDEESVVTGKRPDLPTKHVGFRDLNLSSESGVKALRSRVRRAANDVCGDREAVLLYSVIAQRRCFNGAVAGAEPQIANAIQLYGSNTVAASRFNAIVIAARR
jgi:UrcA family protein